MEKSVTEYKLQIIWTTLSTAGTLRCCYLRFGPRVREQWDTVVQDPKVLACSCSGGLTQTPEGGLRRKNHLFSKHEVVIQQGKDLTEQVIHETEYFKNWYCSIFCCRLVPNFFLTLSSHMWVILAVEPVQFHSARQMTFAKKIQDTRCKIHLNTWMVISLTARGKWHWKTIFLLSQRGKHFPEPCSSTGNRNICSLIHILNQICHVQFKWSKDKSQQQQEKECGELWLVSTLGEWLHRSLIFSSQSCPFCVWVLFTRMFINTGGKKVERQGL